LIQEALGFARPIYAHVPLLLGADRSKLSKRHGATSMDEYRMLGYLPEAMFNYLALLGWNPGTEQEIFSFDELVKEFSLEKVQKAGAIFDVTKLDWMNGEYIRKKTLSELRLHAMPYIESFPGTSHEYVEQILALEQPRLKKLSELPEKIDYFFEEPRFNSALLVWKKMSSEAVRQSLVYSQKIIENIADKDWNKEYMETVFFKECEKYNSRGELLWPLRVALSGKKASPSPFEILYVLGRNRSLQRIQNAAAML
jgi:glutamyl/glutaminyl-tRNA synthetase